MTTAPALARSWILRVDLLEFPAASVATTVTFAVSFTPLRSARRMDRSVLLESASRSRTCLPLAACRTMPLSFRDRLAPASDTVADAVSVQGAAQLASTITPRCLSTFCVPAASSASVGALPVTGAVRLGTVTNGDVCGPVPGPGFGSGVGSGVGSGPGPARAAQTSPRAPAASQRWCPRARRARGCPSGLAEAEVQLPVAGHERLDVVLDRGVGRHGALVAQRGGAERGPVGPLHARLGPAACGRVDSRAVGGTVGEGAEAQLRACTVPAMPAKLKRRRLSTWGLPSVRSFVCGAVVGARVGRLDARSPRSERTAACAGRCRSR